MANPAWRRAARPWGFVPKSLRIEKWDGLSGLPWPRVCSGCCGRGRPRAGDSRGVVNRLNRTDHYGEATLRSRTGRAQAPGARRCRRLSRCGSHGAGLGLGRRVVRVEATLRSRTAGRLATVSKLVRLYEVRRARMFLPCCGRGRPHSWGSILRRERPERGVAAA